MRREILKMCVGCLIIQGVLLADTDDCAACDNYYKQWFAVGHSEGRGVGYHDGYTTFSTFLAAQKDFFSFCPIMDLRWHVFNKGRSAGNFGIGGRAFFNDYEAIGGFNLFYDFRQTRVKTFHQMGVGLEWIGVCWDFTLNGYIPVGSFGSHYYDTSINVETDPTFFGFNENNIMIGPNITHISKKRDFDFSGVDGSARRTIFDNGAVSFDAGIGPYYYFGNYRKDVYGGMFEVTANVLDYVVVSGRVNYDSVFYTTASAQLTIQIPFGCGSVSKKCAKTPCDILERKLVRKVKRNEIMPVKVENNNYSIVDPMNAIARNIFGDPIELLFVNNTNSSAGTGTFENPFNSFAVAENNTFEGNMIYVLPGDGTTIGMDSGFVLKDNQTLIGAGAPFTIRSTSGNVVIPPFGAPLVTNSTGDAFTLANNNTISGFHIFAPLGRGIFGSSLMDTTIINNKITNPLSNTGIQLVDISDLISISGNTIISDVLTPDTSDVGIFVRGDGSYADINISNNSTTNFSSGIRVFETNDSMMISTVSNNSILTPRNIGIDLASGNGGMNKNIVFSNVVRHATNNGISVFAGSTSIKSSEIFGNIISGSGSSGILVKTNDGGEIQANVSENVLIDNNFVAETGDVGHDIMHLKLNGNQSNYGYSLSNSLGSELSINPNSSNSGTLYELGTITPLNSELWEE